MRRYYSLLLISLLSASVSAQELTGKAWIDMDYGPFLSMTIQADGPGRNIAYKGVMVTLDEESQTYALFDEDLMRYAAAWTGGKLNWRSVVYDGSHGTHPSMVGTQIFGNSVRPGWSISGDFSDPRELPYGPLPRGQAHYKGLYLADRNVVFQYTVGGTVVRETPGLERFGDNQIITRTIEIPRSRTNMTLQIAEAPGMGTSLIGEGRRRVAVLGDASAPAVEPVEPVVTTKGLIGRFTFEKKDGLKGRGLKLVKGRDGQALSVGGRQQVVPELDEPPVFGGRDYSMTAWVKSKSDGTVAALTSEGQWVSGGKSLFIRGGRLTLDIGWVGAVSGKTAIADGQWHHVALTQSRDGSVRLYVDGREDAAGKLEPRADPEGSRLVFGRTSNNFPRGGSNQLRGELDDICLYNRVLTAAEVRAMAPEGPPPGITATGVVGFPAGAEWRINDDDSLRLHIPADSTPARFKVLIWSGQADELKAFQAAVAASPAAESLAPLTRGGPTRFPETITTKGRLGTGDKAYVIDELTPPTDNPWRSWMRFGGFDYFDDASKAAICTWNGDVWIVSGINATLSELRWKRIATGMFQPLGVRIVDGDIYVCCRDQITILRDLNGDGEADFYENFNNDHQVTEHFHEFAMDLQTDAKGNFYYAKSARHALDSVVPHHGTLIRVAADGRTSEIVCNGFRAANGVGIGPNGEMSTSDQEGHWTPANRINLVRDGGFYGNMYSYHRGDRPTDYDPPVVWLPKNVDRSPAESLWVTSNKWGPLGGNLISTSYGTGQVFLVPYEQIGSVYQGGAIRFPLDFPTGTMRARFHPDDGQLYVCGLFGWSSNKTRPGGFYRIRYTGRPVHMPVEYHVSSNGVSLKFSEPLDRATAQNVGNYAIRQWNYRWTRNYGSAHWKVSNPKEEGADDVPVKSATLLSDNRTVFLEIENLQTVMQMQFSWSLKDADGLRFEDDMWATINRLGSEFDLEKAMRTPREIVRKVELEPGLVGVSTTLREDVATLKAVTSRLAAWHSPTGRAGVAMLSGKLRVARPGEYEFRVQPASPAMRLRLDGDVIPAGRRVQLSRGDIPIQIHGRSAGRFVVQWRGDSFGWEPIPPSALVHDPRHPTLLESSAREAGRLLFAESGCARCHTLPGTVDYTNGMPELRETAPSLADAASRFEPEWLRDWILDPKSIRPDARMPVLLHGSDKEANVHDAMDIAAYLSTLGSPDAPELPDADGGDRLFEDLGCIACHRTTPASEDDSWNRRSLGHVKRKFRSGALVDFLKQPRKHHPWRRMPDFGLSDDEATKLASYLRSECVDEAIAATEGNPRRGRELFVSVGCANCHSTDAQPARGEMRKLSLVEAGCLAADAKRRGEAPDFRFTQAQRRSLVVFIEHGVESLATLVPAEAAERAIRKLDCTACHSRDGDNGRYREIFADEGSTGRPPELVPPLTWAGEKFKTAWMADFISGRNQDRLRPHLRLRMPRFGEYGQVIAAGLAHQHGVGAEPAPAPTGADQLAAGRQLVGNQGGFNCVQCHGVGNTKPTAAFDALGVNLEQIPARIRRPFYDRWMLDPPRIDPSTKMIKLSTSGKTSVTDVLDGDAGRQFEAIWQYMETLRK